MNTTSSISGLGCVRIEPLAPVRVTPSGNACYVWEPPASMRQDLPADFRLALRCDLVAEDGQRLFNPDGDFEDFMAMAFIGGLALLSENKDFRADERLSYLEMWQFFLRARKSREHYMNSLSCARSLRVSRRGRGDATEYSILPETLGLNAKGQGTPWNVSRLLKEGYDEARLEGISSPEEKDCVHYGLVRAARRDPLYASGDAVQLLFRQAMYETITPPGCGNADEESPVKAARKPVLDRSLRAMSRHLDDLPKFDSWFLGPKNSFLPQIAQQRRAAGGALDRQLVRRVLLDLGWDAYSNVARCIDAAMRNFRRLIPTPLSQAEGVMFDQRYLMQPHFGQLPLALFEERIGVLHSVFWTVFVDPTDRNAIAVLHRLLHYYGEMATKRRSADQRLKAKKVASEKHEYRGEHSMDFEPRAADSTYEPNDEGALAYRDSEEGEESAQGVKSGRGGLSDADAEVFAAIAGVVRRKKGIHCDCAEPIWQDQVNQMDAVEAVFGHLCAGCQFSTETTISMKDLKTIGIGLQSSED